MLPTKNIIRPDSQEGASTRQPRIPSLTLPPRPLALLPRALDEVRADALMPRGLWSWLRFLWTRLLFPGRSPEPEPWHWQPFLLCLLASSALLFPCLSFYLFEPDEGRYAQIPREMLTRGDWLVPTLQGEPYLDKPPLFYWLVMLSYSVFGYHDWAARLIPALAVQAVVALAYLFGRRHLGNRAAFWGTLTLALLPGFCGMGRLLTMDSLFTLWVTLSLFAAWNATAASRLRWGWWLTAACASALGVLTKGPAALVLLVPPLWLQRRLSGSGARIGVRGWLTFAAVVLTLNLPWYVTVTLRLPQFAGYFFWQHNILRFAEPFDHLEPVWYFVPVLLGGFMPATLFLVGFVRFLLSERDEHAAQRSQALGYLLLAAGWCVLFFSLSGSKLPTYIMPAFPPLALALGVYLAQSRWDRSTATRLLYLSAAALTLVAHWGAVPYVARIRSPMSNPQQMAEFCGDRNIAVLCFPRHVNSVAFYLGRCDFRTYRSKNLDLLLQELDKNERTIVLFGHRNSLATLRHFLPPHLHVARSAPMGLTDVALIERR